MYNQQKTLLRHVSVVLLLLLTSVNICSAKYLSPQEALMRVNSSKVAKALGLDVNSTEVPRLLQKISVSDDTKAAVYLFSVNSNKKVMAISANDCAPAMLGCFDVEEETQLGVELPENVEWWLQQYASQIEYVEANPGTNIVIANGETRTPIAPLVITRWGQREPYNSKCPIVSGKNSVVGCVATAMAQVMNYYKWPQRGNGSHSYSSGGSTYSIDFSEIEFAWDNMLGEYILQSDSLGGDAVSTLMKACGYSINMKYGATESSASIVNIVTAGYNYFDYSDKAYYADRRYYTQLQWTDLVYGQLSKGMPVIYSGRGNSSGHCFICDGYDENGYFHFNWGWNGSYDGYFAITDITPKGNGLGGSDSGYNFEQICLVNFCPSNKLEEEIVGYKGSNLKVDNSVKTISTMVSAENVSLAKPLLSFGVEFTSIDGNTVFVLPIGDFSSTSGNYSPKYSLTAEELYQLGLIDGEYQAKIVYKENDKWKDLLYYAENTSSAKMVLEASDIQLSLVEKDYHVTISEVRFNDCKLLLKGCSNILSFLATNNSNMPIYLYSSQHLVPDGASVSNGITLGKAELTLAVGETKRFSCEIPSSKVANLSNGEYYVVIKAGVGTTPYDCIYSDATVLFSLKDTQNTISDGTFCYVEDGNGGVIISGLDNGVEKLSGDVVIPRETTIDGLNYVVCGVASSLAILLDAPNVTSLDIQVPIQSIPSALFKNSTNLTSIKFPPTLLTIGANAFYGCKNLTGELVIPEGVTTIGEGAFYYCENLTGDLTIPNSVTSIGAGAFKNCSGFNGKLTLSNRLTRIEEETFCNCENLIGDLIIPEDVTFIGTSAFSDCESLNGKLSLSKSLTEIKSRAFFYCSNLIGDLVIPYGITSIAENTFTGCENLNGKLSIPNSVKSIGTNAFYNCKNLTGELKLPEDLIEIGSYAFYGCKSLIGTLKIPKAITKISNYTFCGCSGFTGELVIPKNVSTLGSAAFYGCSGFTGDLVIPENVIDLQYYAFKGCSGFNGVLKIPNSLTTIYDRTFDGCSGLTGDLVIPNTITSIGEYAFYDCYGFTGELKLPNSITEINRAAFKQCSGFSGELKLPNSITRIGIDAFYKCSGFTGDLIIPNSVTSIASSAFYACSGMNGTLVLPDSITVINSHVFSGSGFTGDLIIPNNVTAIKEYAFINCSSFDGNLILPEGLTSIDQYAFYKCTGFTGELKFPKSMTYIGSNAFYSCSGFTSFKSENSTPPTASSNSFSKVSTIAPLYVPVGTKSDYAYATGWNVFKNNIIEDATTDIEAIEEHLSVIVNNGTIIVNGSDEDVYVEVYGINGQCLYRGNDTIIPIESKGLFLVKINGSMFKVSL